MDIMAKWMENAVFEKVVCFCSIIAQTGDDRKEKGV